MDIDLPKYHNFPNWSNLKESGNYLRTWEIGVPEEDSLEWSLVLSHLLSANLRTEEDFEKNLQNVTDDLGDVIKIRNCISGFNPFLNRYSCFYNESLKKVVLNFKERIGKAAKHYSNSQNDKLEECSKILKSNILLISTSEKGDAEITGSFPKNDQNPSSRPRITLYYYHKTNQQDCKYNFGMKKEKGKELRGATLKKVLKETHISKQKRNELASLDKTGESFVISILKSKHKSTIPELYKSPYLVWKLLDARYEMDPREKDSDGFSAFYHALLTEDETLIYILYNFAANACHKTDKTFRDPDESIISTLINLRKTLEDDMEMLKDDKKDFQVLEKNCKNVRHSANQLIRFNDFLIQMCKRISEERNQCANNVPNRLSETIARKNVILALLETYDSFFFFDRKQVSGNCFLEFDDYCTYNTYYRNLDYSASLFFFDNIFSLKERLLLNNNEYSELESSFFLSVLSSKYFTCEFSKSIFPQSNHSLYAKSWNNYWNSFPKGKHLEIIPLVERLRLLEKIRTFKDMLLNVVVNDNIVSSIPEDEVYKTLASLPEVKDELEIQRLIHYLETAMKRNAANSKHALAIQRALQVLGECMINGRKNPKSLCFLLSICLPEDTFRSIKQTRNLLSHLEEHTFAPKFKAEKDTFLFQGIQKEMEKIYEVFKSIFDVQTLRLVEFLFRRSLQEIETSCPTIMTEDHKKVLLLLKEEYNKLIVIKSKPCYNNSIFKNIHLITNIRDITQEKIRIIPEKINSEYIEDILWPLRYLLMLIADDCKDLNFIHVESIKKDFHDLLTCGSEQRKDKVEELWKKYEILISELREKTQNPYNLQAKKNAESCIEKFKKMIKGFVYFSGAEKKEIKSKIPQDVQDTLKLKNEIQKVLESGGELTFEQIRKMPTLFLSNKNLHTLKKTYQTDTQTALKVITEANNPIEDLNNLLDGNNRTMKKGDFSKLCERLKFSDDVRKKLLDVGQKQIVPENNLFNILNRIKLLREILIEENTNICDLWRKAKAVKTQQFAKYKIVQRYIRDLEVQASVETLLFDCMILLGEKSDIEHLWVKASSLFSGINLRNVLGHGNPTFETVGKLLDPDDLPSVLVEEMLKLIKDEEVIQTMYNFCLKTGLDFDKFHEVMNDEKYKENVEVCQIRKCERWKRYSMLIQRDTKRNTLISEITESSESDYE